MEAEGVGSPNNLLYRRDQSYAGNQQQIINTMILGERWVGEVEGRGGLSLSRKDTAHRQYKYISTTWDIGFT